MADAMVAILVLALSAALTTAFVPLVRRVAHTGGLYAHPTDDRWHRRPVPKLGGVAMAAAFFPVALYFAETLPLRILVVATMGLFAVGLLDDFRPITPLAKLAAQIGTALLFLAFAPSVGLTGRSAVDVALSFLWFVGITNAFNLLDNIDGLAAGIAAIAAAFLAVAFIVDGSASLASLILVVMALAGVAVGFLIYNWHPASIFMGDSGSHLIGAMLAGTTILAAPNMHGGADIGVFMAVIILLVPCADTALVIITRQLSGQSALVGGRDHLSHRLVALGVDDRRAVLVLCGLAIAGGLAALGVQNLPAWLGWTATIAYGITVLAIGIFLGQVSVEHEDRQTDRRPLR